MLTKASETEGKLIFRFHADSVLDCAAEFPKEQISFMFTVDQMLSSVTSGNAAQFYTAQVPENRLNIKITNLSE
jgi:hypothetical protein